MNRIWKNSPPVLSAISGRVSSVKLNPASVGNRDCANQAATKKIAPPIMSASTMALGTVLVSFASSVYIVIASNPMNEKQTTVAPPITAPRCTPEWNSGARLKAVPLPSPELSAVQVRATNTAMRTIWNATRMPLTREVDDMLNRFIAVIAAT